MARDSINGPHEPGLTAANIAGATYQFTDKKSAAYTQKYLQQSANFYAALDHKTRS